MSMPERRSSSTLQAYAPADLDATLPVLPRPVPAQEVLPMRCLACQGPVQRSTAPVTVARSGYRLTWREVPAWVCTRCGSAYFEPAEVKNVRTALQGLRRTPSA